MRPSFFPTGITTTRPDFQQISAMMNAAVIGPGEHRRATPHRHQTILAFVGNVTKESSAD